MTDRATVYESTQVGKETTPGTGVAANKQLLSLSITPAVEAETDSFVPRGFKYPTIVPLGKEWTSAEIEGKAAYNDLVYPLAGLVGAPTITTPGGGTASRQHVFTPNSSSADTPVTFTVENGSDVRANKFVHGIVTGFGMTFNRDEVEVDGEMIGKQLQDGITKTADPTALALVPVLPKDVTVYLDTTAAGLGTTVLERVVEVEWSIEDKYGPIWVVNAANASWANHVELVPDFEITMSVEADAVGMGFLTQLRAGTTKFLRIEAESTDFIEGAIPYLARFDFAMKVTEAGDFDDEDGIQVIEWTMTGVHDATWGQSYEFTLVNTITAL